MLARYTIAAVAGSALLAGVAFAQTPSATTTDKAGPPSTTTAASASSLQGDWRTSKVVGLSVYNDKNESLGSINDLLTDKSGNIKAVVIGVGGFLGVGEHLVAIPWDKVKFVDQPVAYSGAGGAAPKSATNTAPGAATQADRTTTGAASTSTSTNTAPAATTSKPNPWYPDHAVFNATKDELKAMPEFKYNT